MSATRCPGPFTARGKTVYDVSGMVVATACDAETATRLARVTAMETELEGVLAFLWTQADHYKGRNNKIRNAVMEKRAKRVEALVRQIKGRLYYG